RGREWDISGFQATRPVPLPRSRIPAESAAPRHRRCRRCCPRNTGHEGFSGLSYRDHRGASAPAAYASRMMLPPSLQGALPAGWLAFTRRESNPLDHDERFPSCYISSPLPGFTLTLRCPKPTRYAKSADTYIAYQVMAIVPDRARRRSQHADHRLILRAQHNVKKILLHLSNRPPTGCDRNYAGSLGPA